MKIHIPLFLIVSITPFLLYPMRESLAQKEISSSSNAQKKYEKLLCNNCQQVWVKKPVEDKRNPRCLSCAYDSGRLSPDKNCILY